ncbi:MAG: type II secretion system protein [Gammaproteobacteria bacterium]|nr:type II secretion system protein [Gammaproteobacteria bacterium]
MSLRARQRGATLIELIVFLVIVGIAAAGVMEALTQAQSGGATPIQILEATKLAESRLEFLAGQSEVQSFATLTDPCAGTTPPPVCQLPPGYQIAQPTVVPDFGKNPALTALVVQVTAPDGRVLATLTDVVAEY